MTSNDIISWVKRASQHSKDFSSHPCHCVFLPLPWRLLGSWVSGWPPLEVLMTLRSRWLPGAKPCRNRKGSSFEPDSIHTISTNYEWLFTTALLHGHKMGFQYFSHHESPSSAKTVRTWNSGEKSQGINKGALRKRGFSCEKTKTKHTLHWLWTILGMVNSCCKRLTPAAVGSPSKLRT